MRTILAVVLLSSACIVFGSEYHIPSNREAMPCERRVPLTAITRAVIPMTPLRGVNIIFPYKLPDDTTEYIPSGRNIWSYQKASGGTLVPIFFKNFKPSEFGEVQDFTIKTPHHIVSLALKADPDMHDHCTNIILTLTPAEKKRLEEEEKKNYMAQLDAEYKKKFSQLDKTAEDKALTFVASLTNDNPNTTSIYENGSFQNAKGDTITLYVDKAKKYGKFSILMFSVKNASSQGPLYINSLNVGVIGKGKQRKPLDGHADYNKKIDTNSTESFTFATLESIPDTNGFVTIDTNEGKLDVTW